MVNDILFLFTLAHCLVYLPPPYFICVITMHKDNVDVLNRLVPDRVPGDLRTLEDRTVLSHEFLESELTMLLL